jgi:hypothetical protein
MSRPKLADEIRSVSQPPPATAEQIEFERFLKCQDQRIASNVLAAALSDRSHHRQGSTDAPLIAPSALLPPMF